VSCVREGRLQKSSRILGRRSHLHGGGPVALEKIAACAFVCLLAVAGWLAVSAAPLSVSGLPQRYYLALGDSLTYGIQPAKVDAGLPPSKFDSGFVDVFGRRLRALNPKLEVVNYGCPGESTRTFVAGGCPWLAGGRALHDSFAGAQLNAALAFLRRHPNAVSPITLNLGGNDAQAVADACKNNFACARARAPKAMAQIGSRLGSILHQLRVVAPKAEVIVIGVWNNDIRNPLQSDPLYRAFDLSLGQVAAKQGARFADPFPLFNPQGNLARKRARICAYTFICTRGDGHPTDSGYRALATAVIKASRYTQRS
jgi:lysophospholipase L1-like esterase